MNSGGWTGRGDGAHQEPLVEVGNAPGARQGWLEQRRRALELEEVTVLTLGAKPALHPNIDLPLGS